MRKLKVSKVWIPAFLLAVVMAGCGDSDVSGGPTSPLTPPTVLTVTPNGTLACPNNAPPYHCNIQQGDELCDDQHHYVYFDLWRGERVWGSYLRCGDQCCHLHALG